MELAVPNKDDTNADLWEAHAGWWQREFTAGADPEYTEQIIPLVLEWTAGFDRILEVGTGEGQVARAMATAGAAVVGVDPTHNQISEATRRSGGPTYVRSGAESLSFPSATFDAVVCCLVFEHIDAVDEALAEVSRVLRPGGRFVFSTTHPIRWALPDDPGYPGLTVTSSYFDRTPYVEERSGATTYVEHHRTMGDRVRELTAAGLRLVDLVEPEWPDENLQVWGGWSPLRGALIPGTAIFVCEKC